MWIQTILPAQAQGELLRAYEQLEGRFPSEYRGGFGKNSEGIVAAHSLLPDVMKATFTAYGDLLSPELPLSRRKQEMIATVVSAINSCFY